MEETVFTATVRCKVPLTAADLRFLQDDIRNRLQVTLVQKLASVEFREQKNGNN